MLFSIVYGGVLSDVSKACDKKRCFNCEKFYLFLFLNFYLPRRKFESNRDSLLHVVFDSTDGHISFAVDFVWEFLTNMYIYNFIHCILRLKSVPFAFAN